MNLEQENYKNLTPFKFWTLTNFPFIEQTFDSLTNYELMCKLGEYLNNLEYNQNTVQNNMTNLYTYVRDYFNNLDVTDEINAKLDKLAEDGTLTNLISTYVTPYITEQNNLIAQQNTNINEIETKVNSVASGSPAGVYNTLAELQTDDPDHSKIYVVLEDGEWYFWNDETTQWENGGVYQSTQIANNSVTKDMLKIGRYCNIVSYTSNIEISIENNLLTVNAPVNTIVEYEDNFFSITASNKTKEINQNVLTYIVANKQNDVYVLDILNITEFQAINNRNELFIIAMYYQTYLLPIFNKKYLKVDESVKYLHSEYEFVTFVGNGYLNVDTINKNVTIKSGTFLICPALWNPTKSLINISSDVTIPFLSISAAQTLYFDTIKEEFKFLNSQTKGIHNLIPILLYYQNSVIPLCSPEKIYINEIPYYNKVLNLNISGALSQTINQCMQDIANPTNKTKIVLTGDSITHGVGGTGFAQNGETIIGNYKRNPNGYCWANLFKSYIENNYNATVINNACTGTKIQFLAENINTLVPTDTDILIIAYGTNNRITHETEVGNRLDDLTSIYNTFNNSLNIIINYCLTHNIKYVLQTPPPASATNEADYGRLTHIYDIANIIQSLSAVKNTEYNNLYKLIYNYCKDNNINWNNYLSDGLHPNDNGYKIMFYKILEGLNLAPSYIDIQ